MTWLNPGLVMPRSGRTYNFTVAQSLDRRGWAVSPNATPFGSLTNTSQPLTVHGVRVIAFYSVLTYSGTSILLSYVNLDGTKPSAPIPFFETSRLTGDTVKYFNGADLLRRSAAISTESSMHLNWVWTDLANINPTLGAVITQEIS
jgi:hypothetical protein